jgi:hypothetical protein
MGMTSRNYKVEISIEQIGDTSWAIYGMENGKLGELEGFTTEIEVERHIQTTMRDQYPEGVEIVVVQNRKPYTREHSVKNVMRDVNSKKKPLSGAGCSNIAREMGVGEE